MRLLRFSLDNQLFGLSAATVAEIVRAVAITPLPRSPGVVEGIIDVRGTIVPVFDLRQRFGYPERPLSPDDQFVIVTTSARQAALHVDRVIDLVEMDDASVADPSAVVTGVPHVAGIAQLPDGMVLIHDAETFLSAAEADTLELALDVRAGAVRAGG